MYNMIVEKGYRYSIISSYEFGRKLLESKSDGSKYKRFFLLYYNDGNKMKSVEIPDQIYLKNYSKIIKLFEVEEIISTCLGFDNAFERVSYYHVDDLYFIKYRVSKDLFDSFDLNDDSKVIEKKIE